MVPILRPALSIIPSRGSRTITASILDHAAQFLNLAGEAANLLLHFSDAVEFTPWIDGVAHARFGSPPVGALLVAFTLTFDALLHLARHLLQILRRFVQPCGTQVANGFHKVAKTRMYVTLGPIVMTFMIP
jgi:hypothetical protein